MERWAVSPLLVSFDSVTTGVYEIPFPALTVCNINKESVTFQREGALYLSTTPELTFKITPGRINC